MRTCLGLFTVLALGAVAHAAGQPAEKKPEQWDGSPKPLKGDYQVYGGTLSEVVPPTKNDRKIAFMFTGPLAKQLFDQIGPDAKLSCSDAPGYRERNKRDLSCTYTKEDGYTCYFGLDVTTGKSTRGSIC
jgi:hypothetical protein